METTSLAGTCVRLTANGFPSGKGSYAWAITSGDAAFVDPPPSARMHRLASRRSARTSQGTSSVTVTFTANDGSGSDTKTARITFVQVDIKVKEVSFVNDLELQKDEDTGITPITDPVWVKGNSADQNGRVPRTVGSRFGTKKIKLSVKFEITPPSPVDVNVEFEGEVPGSGMIRKKIKLVKNTNEIMVETGTSSFPSRPRRSSTIHSPSTSK